jgi:sugar-phosphatase
MLRAVLFDLDGTLIDSERESAEGIARALDRHGLALSPAERDFMIGHSWLQIHERLLARLGANLPPLSQLMAEAAEERERIFAERGVTLLPGAATVPRWLFERAPLAIVSGSCRREARSALAAAQLADLFQFILTAEDYHPGKPEPAGFLAAAARLGAEPPECLVIEESAAGVAAGRAAGMTVVAVGAGNFSAQDQSLADVVVDTLEGIDEPLLARLFP